MSLGLGVKEQRLLQQLGLEEFGNISSLFLIKMLAADGRWVYAASRSRVVMCGSLDFAQTGAALVTWALRSEFSSL